MEAARGQACDELIVGSGSPLGCRCKFAAASQYRLVRAVLARITEHHRTTRLRRVFDEWERQEAAAARPEVLMLEAPPRPLRNAGRNEAANSTSSDSFLELPNVNFSSKCWVSVH